LLNVKSPLRENIAKGFLKTNDFSTYKKNDRHAISICDGRFKVFL